MTALFISGDIPTKKTGVSSATSIIVTALTDFLNNEEIQNQKYYEVLSSIMNMLTDEYGINPGSRNKGILSCGFMEKNHSSP